MKHYFVLCYKRDDLFCYLSKNSIALEEADIFADESAVIVADKFRQLAKGKEAHYRALGDNKKADESHDFWTTLELVEVNVTITSKEGQD